MEETKLLEIINIGETQEVELKQSFHSSQDFSKLMCGLANTFGGMIIVGVAPNKKVTGIDEDLDEIQQKISASAQAVSSAVIPLIEVNKLGRKKIIIITIQKAIDNIFHTFQGVIYVKSGSTLRKIEGSQMLDFLRNKQILCFDETNSDAKIADLDIALIKDYLQMRKQEDFLSSHYVEDFLISSKLATKNGELKIKNATLLFFTKEPAHFHPQIEIKLVRFEGIEPVKIVAHQLIQSNIIDSIEKSLAFLKNNLSKSIEITDKPRRKEVYEYPLEVVREAIVNAVAHRDYFSKDSIQIYLFSNRIEITSPGSLPVGLTKELFGALSVRRNPIVYRILRDYGYVEGLGSGVPRMINGMREQSLQDPVFGIYEHFFRVILYNEKSELKPVDGLENLNERQRKAVEFLRKNKSLKTKTYMEINKASYGTANKDIAEMLKFKYIKKVGEYRGAYYVLNGKR